MINAICIQNYRSIQDLTLRLGPLNVLLGKNGAGKSNLLDSFSFLADVMRTDVRTALLQENRVSFEDVVYQGKRHNVIALQMEIQGEAIGLGSLTPWLYYQVAFALNPTTSREIDVALEGLWALSQPFLLAANEQHPHGQAWEYLPADAYPLIEAGRARRDDSKELESFSFSPNRTAASQLTDRARYPQVTALAAALSQFKVFRLEPDAIRKPATITFAPELQSDGSNLAAVLDQLDHSQLEAIASELRQAVPGFSGLKLETAGPGQKVITVREKHGLTLYPHQISDGALRFLALTAIAYGAVAAPLIAIEEPENGINPVRLFQVVELLRSQARSGQQIIMTTHAPYIVDRLEPEELILLVREDGPTRRAPTSASEIARRQREFGPLGELWFSGALEHVPN